MNNHFCSIESVILISYWCLNFISADVSGLGFQLISFTYQLFLNEEILSILVLINLYCLTVYLSMQKSFLDTFTLGWKSEKNFFFYLFIIKINTRAKKKEMYIFIKMITMKEKKFLFIFITTRYSSWVI